MQSELKHLPFGFSSLVVLDPLGGSLNPLGLVTTQTKLARSVFPQFTVLTNRPRNHALLCGIITALTELNIQVDPKEIRKAEALWGLGQALRAQTSGGPAPLNIRRYELIIEAFKDQKRIDLNGTCQTRFGLLNRLGYGVWGFYARPSQVWRTLNASTRKLSDLGIALGHGFNLETGFKDLLVKWFSGKSIALGDSLLEFAEGSRLDIAELGRQERNAWISIYKQFRQRTSKSKDPQADEVWDILPTASKIDSWVEEKSYSKFFDRISEGTDKKGRLYTAIQAQMHFERAVSWIELAFEALYLLAQIREDIEPLQPSDWETMFNEAKKEVVLFEAIRAEFGSQPAVFSQVNQARNVTEFKSAILRVHNDVQTRKNKGAYLAADGTILQEGSMNCERAIQVFEKIKIDGKMNPDFIRFIYRRDWHYGRAVQYKESLE